MRKKLIAGNWKMHLNFNQAMSLIADLVQIEKRNNWNDTDVAIYPPALYTRHAVEFLSNAQSRIKVGVQNCAATSDGAYTGELSANMLKAAGASMVLIGHSERRAYFNEDSNVLFRKLEMSLNAGLTPVLCCGEQLEDRKSVQHFHCVSDQLNETLFRLSEESASRVIIAYEPVWAIGTGETASPEQAQQMHAHIRSEVRDKFDENTATNMRVLYGGSMKPENAVQLLSQPDVDGGLIGGASLQADQFSTIITS
ncbi:MAG: triose-phosphate isomerase [Salibacteraceae bacterium]